MKTVWDGCVALVSVCGIALWTSQPATVVQNRESVVARPLQPQIPEAQKFKLTNGEFTIQVKWGLDQLEQREQLEARISFLPDPQRCPVARSIKIIQIAKVLDNEGRDIEWNYGESNRNRVRTPGGWFVDHRAVQCVKGKPASPFYGSYWTIGARAGSNLPDRPASPALIEDAPTGWDEMSAIALETCAVDEDTGAVLASIQWGGEWSTTPNARPTLNSCSASDSPTINFVAALKMFNDFYSGPSINSVVVP